MRHQTGTKEQDKSGETSLEESLVDRIAVLTQRLGLAEGSIAQLRAELPSVLHEAASELEDERQGRTIVITPRAAEKAILMLVQQNPGITFAEISKFLRNKFDEAEVANMIFELGREELVTWGDGNHKSLDDTNRIYPLVLKNGKETRQNLVEPSPESAKPRQ